MNIAKVIEIDGAPMLLIYAKTHSGHQHHGDIEGFTDITTGGCTSHRFEGQPMPQPGEETTVWLANRTQEVLGARIEHRPWDGGIDIMRVHDLAASAA